MSVHSTAMQITEIRYLIFLCLQVLCFVHQVLPPTVWLGVLHPRFIYSWHEVVQPLLLQQPPRSTSYKIFL